MRPLSVLPQEVTDAVTIVSGLGVAGGALAWLGWLAGALIFRRSFSVERWVIHGAGFGGAAGLLVAAFSLGR